MSETIHQRIPLERRLADVRSGTLLPSTARAIALELALTPATAVRPDDPAIGRELEGLARIEATDRLNPAVRCGWDVDRSCLASAAWAIDCAFRLRDRAQPGSDVRRGFARSAARATETLSELVEPVVTSRLAWFAAPGADGGEPWDGVSANQLFLRAGEKDDDAVAATPRQVSSAYGLCLLTVGQLYDAVGQLAAERGAARTIGRRPPAGWEGRRVLSCLYDARAEVGERERAELLRPVLVSPLAELWASGALRGLARERAERERSASELERRLAAR